MRGPLLIVAALVVLVALLWRWMPSAPEPGAAATATEDVAGWSRAARSAATPETPFERAAVAALEPASPAVESPEYSSEAHLDWSSLVEWENGPGVLRGVVLRGAQPVADASIELRARNDRWPPRFEGAPLRSASSDGEGRFRFDSLTSGAYRLSAKHAQEFVEQPRLDFDSSKPNRVAYLVFGRSVIEGRVHDEHGLPHAGQCIAITGIGPAPARATWAFSDSQGLFRCTGLIAGVYNVHLEQTGAWEGDRERKIELGIADTAVVHFGRAASAVRWTGRIVDAGGDAIPGRRALEWRHSTRKDRLMAFTNDAGEYSRELEDGRWRMYVRTSCGAALQADEEQLDGRDIERDSTHPGVRVVVEVSLEGAGGDAESAAESLRLIPASNGAACEPERLGNGRVQWLGLASGVYELEGWNLAGFADQQPFGPYTVTLHDDLGRPRRLRIELHDNEPVRHFTVQMTHPR
jgi:hypothetical protein